MCRLLFGAFNGKDELEEGLEGPAAGAGSGKQPEGIITANSIGDGDGDRSGEATATKRPHGP